MIKRALRQPDRQHFSWHPLILKRPNSFAIDAALSLTPFSESVTIGSARVQQSVSFETREMRNLCFASAAIQCFSLPREAAMRREIFCASIGRRSPFQLADDRAFSSKGKSSVISRERSTGGPRIMNVRAARRALARGHYLMDLAARVIPATIDEDVSRTKITVYPASRNDSRFRSYRPAFGAGKTPGSQGVTRQTNAIERYAAKRISSYSSRFL